jgi:hypothetical protein
MKYASGKARTASAIVTAAAIPIVRRAIVRYALDSKIVRKLPSVQWCSISVVNGLTVQNDETKSATSEAR